MLRFWKSVTCGLTLGASFGIPTLAHAEPPSNPRAPRVSAQSLRDAAFWEDGEAPASSVEQASYQYSPSTGVPARWGLPPMIGDFFPGYAGGAQLGNQVDRLFVAADDLDAPPSFADLNQQLTITESGPLAIFRNGPESIQQIQSLLRANQPLTGATQVGTVNDNATLTTAGTIADVQNLLSSTPGVAFDIIPLTVPPASYQSAVDAVFQATNPGGETILDQSASGAVLQGGVDTLNGGEDLDAFYYYTYVVRVNVPTPSAGTGGVGRSRIAENGTTTPQDRIFFDYGFFDRVGFVSGSTSLNRYTPGFEKTILNDMASIEMRFPIATTVGEQIFESGATSTDEIQFGNIAIYLKGLLYEENGMGLSGGLGVTLPTADGLAVNFLNGGPLVTIDNESYHLQPFLGGYYAPNDRFFTQAFLQLDLDLNGNPVHLNADGTGLREAGRLDDATFLFLDWSVGYWLTRGGDAPLLPVSSLHETGQVTQNYHPIGIAPTLELHYTRSLDDVEAVSSGLLTVGNFADDVDTLTMVVGTHIEIGDCTNIGLGYATSLSGNNQEPFDGAFRLTLNKFFGRN